MPEHATAAPPENNAPAPAPASPPRFRLLILTTDTSVFTAESRAQRAYRDLAARFSALTIIVLNVRQDGSHAPLQLSDTIEVRATNSRFRLLSMRDARRMVNRHLCDGTRFLPDGIIATDPYYAGAVARTLARMHAVPFILDVAFDPFVREERARQGWVRTWIARRTLPGAALVMVHTEALREAFGSRYRMLRDRIAVLPPFRDLSVFREAAASFDLTEKYPNKNFFILVLTEGYGRESLLQALDICAPFLHEYRTAALIYIGVMRYERDITRQALRLRVRQRVFVDDASDELVSFMKSGHLLLSPAPGAAGDFALAAAAAAGLPILTASGGIADTIFEDGVSALICAPGDTACFQAKLGAFINDNHLRTTLAINGYTPDVAQLGGDTHAYRDAYAGHVEACLAAAHRAEPLREPIS